MAQGREVAGVDGGDGFFEEGVADDGAVEEFDELLFVGGDAIAGVVDGLFAVTVSLPD